MSYEQTAVDLEYITGVQTNVMSQRPISPSARVSVAVVMHSNGKLVSEEIQPLQTTQ